MNGSGLGWILILGVWASSVAVLAEVKLPAVLADNMVLQQDRPIPATTRM